MKSRIWGKKRLPFAFLCAFLLLLTGCKSEPYEKSAMLLDTVVTLRADGVHGREAVEESLLFLARLDASATPNKAGSDPIKLKNSAGSGTFVPIEESTYHMLEVAQEYAEKTDGAYDVTTGAIVKLWGIGTDAPHVPTKEELARAKARVGFRHLHLQKEACAAMLDTAGMEIDLGSLAKGYALDEIRKIYAKHGVENGLINLGASSLYALGKNAKGKDWRVAIHHPRQTDGKPLGIFSITNAALSTSGDYERYFEQDGVRYHHILNPHTGVPAENSIIALTIVVDGNAPDAGLLSDLLTTAVFVLGKEDGKKLIEESSFPITGEITTKDFKIHPMKSKVGNDFTATLSDVNKNFTLSY